MVFEMFTHPDAPYHNGTSYYVRDDKPFSLDTLRAAAAMVVARHEALRTSIDLSSYSRPMQLVHAEAEMPVGAQDLRHLPEDEQEREIRRYMSAERRRLFDLEHPTLMRLFAHLTSGDGWWISITECHPIIEGWGYHLMLMEVLTCYNALQEDRTPELRPLPEIRFADFVAAELEALRSPEDIGYWKQVVTETPPLAIPASWGGGPKEEHPVYDIEMPFEDLRESLLNFASRARVPLKSVMHAAHLKVMSMLTIEPGFSTGLVCDARPEATGADRVFGMYLNTVPFGFSRGADTWMDLVRQVFAREVELWPHRRYPVAAIQREVTGGGRLNQILFNYLDFNTVDSDLVDIHTGIDYSPNEFQLVIVAHRSGLLRLSAKPETVSRPYGELLMSMYRKVLEAMAADSGGDARGSLLPDEEWERVVRTHNRTDVEWPEAMTHGLFEDRARENPGAVAVIAQDGTEVTYGELNARANRLAHHLRGLGVVAESFVGVCVDHSVDMLVALLGMLKSGGAYVPLDPAHPNDRLAFMLADTGAPLVVTSERLRGALPADGDRTSPSTATRRRSRRSPARDPDAGGRRRTTWCTRCTRPARPDGPRA